MMYTSFNGFDRLDSLHFEFDIINIVVLVIMFVYLVFNDSFFSKGQRSLKICMVFMFLLVFNRILYTIFTSISFEYSYVWIMASVFFFFLFQPLFCIYYVRFICDRCDVDKTQRSGKLLYILPYIFGFIQIGLLLCNAFNHIFYAVDEVSGALEYQRTAVVLLVFPVLFFIESLLVLIYNKRKLMNSEFLSSFSSIFIYSIGIVLQIFIKDIDFVWPFMSLWLFLTFLFALVDTGSKDVLTRFSNRNELVLYVKYCIRRNRHGKYVNIYMLDIDDFKLINDAYGHAEGDEALKIAADVIRDVFKKGSFFARYGGDEFVVMSISNEEEKDIDIDEAVNDNIAAMLSAEGKEYVFTFSIGKHTFKPRDKGLTENGFFDIVDENMYKRKIVSKPTVVRGDKL